MKGTKTKTDDKKITRVDDTHYLYRASDIYASKQKCEWVWCGQWQEIDRRAHQKLLLLLLFVYQFIFSAWNVSLCDENMYIEWKSHEYGWTSVQLMCANRSYCVRMKCIAYKRESSVSEHTTYTQCDSISILSNGARRIYK